MTSAASKAVTVPLLPDAPVSSAGGACPSGLAQPPLQPPACQAHHSSQARLKFPEQSAAAPPHLLLLPIFSATSNVLFPQLPAMPLPPPPQGSWVRVLASKLRAHPLQSCSGRNSFLLISLDQLSRWTVPSPLPQHHSRPPGEAAELHTTIRLHVVGLLSNSGIGSRQH